MTIDDLPDFLTIEETAHVLRIGRGQAYELARIWRVSGGVKGIPNVSFGSKPNEFRRRRSWRFLNRDAKHHEQRSGEGCWSVDGDRWPVQRIAS